MHIRHSKQGSAPTPPPGPAGGRKLKSILSAQGDWFRLQIAYDSPEPSRLFLSRVALWAIAEGADVVDHIIGIDETGVPSDDSFMDVYYVCGADLSPNGSTWNEVYGSVRPSLQQVREVTHLFEGID